MTSKFHIENVSQDSILVTKVLPFRATFAFLNCQMSDPSESGLTEYNSIKVFLGKTLEESNSRCFQYIVLRSIRMIYSQL